ncbi:TIGR04222 domain-containing membrane protein [Pannus brasiliensis CCIBt3594]|uniref:TIGR04222 domain-containing membrane protein n=1 Tax=Pannus brasiliensis CCIBt3594 TaxID=1427578 RepID=A0AAW9QNM9_9CHRO
MNPNFDRMTPAEVELYERIQSFSPDRPGDRFPFSKRLAKENGWSPEYTERAIGEYKKFTFLAMVAGHIVSPSEQVDRVWHLHLTYTRSYWEEFCRDVLQQPLHHEPTRGGESERVKFHDLYDRTLESYERFFGEVPPPDIWPPAKIRFGKDLHFVWINTRENWILPKIDWLSFGKVKRKKIKFIFVLLLISMMIISGHSSAGTLHLIDFTGQPFSPPQLPPRTTAETLDPIDFTGPRFLFFYSLISLFGLGIAYWSRRSLCSTNNGNPPPENLTPYEIAYLAGGKSRVRTTAIASLLQQGFAEIVDDPSSNPPKAIGIKKEVDLNSITDPIEKEVAQKISRGDEINALLFYARLNLEYKLKERLQQLGLLLTEQRAAKAHIYPAMILIFLLGLGVLKILVGLSRGSPVLFLIFLCFGLLYLSGQLFQKPSVSVSGERFLAEFRNRQYSSLKTANKDDPELLLSIAMFGTGVLVWKDCWPELYRVLYPSVSRPNSNDGGGGCGGGGCGCGGCGGCGCG